MVTFFHKARLSESADNLPRRNTAFFAALVCMQRDQVTLVTNSRSDFVEKLAHDLDRISSRGISQVRSRRDSSQVCGAVRTIPAPSPEESMISVIVCACVGA